MKQESSEKCLDEQENFFISLDPQKAEITEKSKFKKCITRFYGIFFALLTAVCSGMVSVTVKGANFFSGTDISLFRYTIQLILMLIIGRCTKTNLIGVKEIRKNVILIGFFYSSFVLLLYISYKLIDPSEGTALSRLNMLIIPIIARFYMKEKFHIINLLPLLMAIFGVLFISQPSFLFNSKKKFQNSNLTNGSNYSLSNDKGLERISGIIIALFSAFLSSLGQILSKKVADKKIHFSVPIIYQSFFGIPFSLLLSSIYFFTGAHKYDFDLVKDFKNIFFQVSFALIASSFGVLFQIFLNCALKYENNSIVAIIVSTALLFSFLAQYLILNINPNFLSTIGVLLIFFSTSSVIFFQMFEKLLLNNKKYAQNGNSHNRKEIFSWKKKIFFKI